MRQIPLNNETMGFNQEVYFDILKQREAILKAEEENKKKREEYLKLTEPFRKELENLRKEELEKLLSNKKFIKYCKKWNRRWYCNKRLSYSNIYWWVWC